jgi:hypothetical protein
MLQIFKINNNTYSNSTLKLPLETIIKIFEFDPSFYIFKTEDFKFELKNNILIKIKSIIEEGISYDIYKNHFGIFIENPDNINIDIDIENTIPIYNEFNICSKKYDYYTLFAVVPKNYYINNITNYESIIFKYKNKNKISENILEKYNYYYDCNPFIIFLDKIKKYIFLLEINDIESIKTFNFNVNIDEIGYIYDFDNFENSINKYAKICNDDNYIVKINKNYILEQEIKVTKNKQLLFEIENHEFNIVKDFFDNYIEDCIDYLTKFNYIYYENSNYDFNDKAQYKIYFKQEKYYKKFVILPIDFNTNMVKKYDGIVFKYKNIDKIPKNLFLYYNMPENYMEQFIKNAKNYLNNLSETNNFSYFYFPFYWQTKLHNLNNYARNFSNDANVIYVHHCEDPFITKLAV